jgi:ParB/RepB/Spo0J family partition protein
MATKVKKRFKPAVDESKPPVYEEKTLLISLIETSPKNPRREFDPEAIQSLADSIARNGLLQRLVVRPKPLADGEDVTGKVLLVAGERRLRALQLLKWDMVPVRCAEMTDRQAAVACIAENMNRADLSAIEEANGFRALIEEHGYTQAELGEILKCSQSRVANALRLLKLPESWQQRIISQEIPPTHCRAVLKYAEYPSILDAIAEEFWGEGDTSPIGSKQQFAEVVEDVAAAVTRPLAGTRYCSKLGREVEIFEPNDAERAALALVEVDGFERASNVELWESLQADHEQRLADDIDGVADLSDDEPEDNGTGDGDGGAAADVERYEADDSAGAEESEPEAKGAAGAKVKTKPVSAKDAAARLKADIAVWRANWLRYLLSLSLADDFMFCMNAVLMHLQLKLAGHNAHDIAVAVNAGDGSPRDVLSAIALFDKPTEVFVEFVPGWFWADGEPSRVFSDEAVEVLAEASAIDLDKAWETELAGPLTEAFFNLHSRGQLEALAHELGVASVAGQVTKPGIISALLTDEFTKNGLPMAIATVKDRTQLPMGHPAGDAAESAGGEAAAESPKGKKAAKPKAARKKKPKQKMLAGK